MVKSQILKINYKSSKKNRQNSTITISATKIKEIIIQMDDIDKNAALTGAYVC